MSKQSDKHASNPRPQKVRSRSKNTSDTRRQGQRQGQNAAAHRQVRRERFDVALALERAEAEVLRKLGDGDLNALVDRFRDAEGGYVVPTDRASQRLYNALLTVLDLRRRRVELFGPHGARATYDARLFLASLHRGWKARQQQQATQHRQQQRLLQPIADGIPPTRTRTAAAVRIAAKLDDTGPKSDTIRKLIGRGIITSRRQPQK